MNGIVAHVATHCQVTLVICILILFLGYAILLADKFVKEFTALHSKQRKKPQGA
jgi:hypothetical protein